MTQRKELTDFIYRSVLTSVLAILIFLEIYNFYDPELIIKKNVFSLIIISLCFNALIIIYHKIHFYIIPAIVLAGVLFYFIIDKEDIELILYSNLFKLVIIGFASFIIFFITDLSVKINLVLSLGMLVYLLVTMFRKTEVHPSTPALVIFYTGFSITRFMRDYFKKADSKRVRTYITYLYPFLLFALLLLLILPKPENPISWKWAKDLYDYTVEKINEIGHELSIYFSSSESYDSFSVNFGMQDELSYDNENITDDVVMTYTLSGTVSGGIYLRGEYFNEFRNGGWVNTLNSKKDYSTIDALETVYGIYNFDADYASSFIRTRTINIRYQDLTTSIMFSPPKATSYNKKVAYSRNEHTLFEKVKTYGTEYSIDFILPNYGSRAFLLFMKAPLSDNNEALQKAKNTYLRGLYPDIELSDIYEYRDYIKENYSSEPEIKDSVKEWINLVIDGAESDYEKLLKVENALSSMTYSLEAGNLPDHVKTEGDFLNYFITEKHSGYCVHFATAFCLIARYLGFESRVVHGYSSRVALHDATDVLNSSGHLWPEVYFKGKGWIAFEPTPGFGRYRYDGWESAAGKYSESEEDSSSYNNNYVPPVPVYNANEPVEENNDENENRVSGLLIIIILAIIIFSIILVILLNTILSHYRHKRMSEEELYFLEFKKTMNILKEFKLKREQDETTEEFSLKCQKELIAMANGCDLPEPNSVYSDISFFEIYEKSMYGNYTPGSDDTKELKKVSLNLTVLLRKFYGYTYLIHKLHLMIVQAAL